MLQTTETNLDPKQEKALTELLQQPTIQAAADATGVARSTLYRWLQDPEFASAYRAARSEALAHATARLQQLASEAVDALGTVIGNADAAPKDRISAARTVLDFAYSAHDLEALAAALDDLKDNDNES